MKKRDFPIAKHIVGACLLLSCIGYVISCVTTAAVKPAGASHKKGEGKLITNDGYTFPYKFYPLPHKGPTVIYIAGMGGKVTTEGRQGQGQGGYTLASSLNKAKFNFIGFNRMGFENVVRSPGIEFEITKRRSKNGSLMLPTFGGGESSAENIVRNEIATIIEFVERAPNHDSEQGIYLIGGSYGSWLSLVTVSSFPEKINGVIFLSPAILPNWVIGKEYFQSLIHRFGQRPALAIGSKKDKIDKNEDGTAWDAVQLLKREIGSTVEVMEVFTFLHANELVEGSREVREKIVQWLSEQVEKQ